MKTMKINKIVFTAACIASGVYASMDDISTDYSSTQQPTISLCEIIKETPQTIASNKPKRRVEKINSPFQSLLKKNDNFSKTTLLKSVSSSINDCMGLIKKFIRKNKVYVLQEHYVDEKVNEKEDLLSLAIYLNTTQMLAVSSESKNALMNAILDFDYNRIGKELRNIYISLVNSNNYNIKFVSSQNSGKNTSNSIYASPFFRISTNYMSKPQIGRIECIKKDEKVIKKALDFINMKKKLSDKNLFTEIFTEEKNVSEKTTAKSEIKHIYSAYTFFSTVIQKTLTRKEKSQSASIKKKEKSSKLYTICKRVEENSCTFSEWQKTFDKSEEIVESKNIGKYRPLLEVPWAYLDARIFANTDLSFDLAVVIKIVNSILKFESETNQDCFFCAEFKKLSPVFHTYISFLKSIISTHVSQLEMNNKSAIWIKARIYNIVIRYIKKELTPSLIRYTLEQIVCDILLHIEECNIISKSEIVDFILKTAQNACPEVKLVSEDKKKVYQSRPCTIPMLLHHLYTSK
ncbi:hypothetical protein NEPAR06_0155 [Nematocida parisii]|nr:hypothetical protein NEPAR03_2144 [Nematocida parisii]KAI5130883.1 hypothetical protein NEPAR08_2236 [Nematocida parisii]KAI5153077.1 hypothetical protein NEPAR06_0155 [Nematocida parisii]KAI5158510.1 hypothetical protein NEPAR05_2044 [Nematocida parisii]